MPFFRRHYAYAAITPLRHYADTYCRFTLYSTYYATDYYAAYIACVTRHMRRRCYALIAAQRIVAAARRLPPRDK